MTRRSTLYAVVALVVLAVGWFACGSRPRGAPTPAVEALPELEGLGEVEPPSAAGLAAPRLEEESFELEAASSFDAARESVVQAPLAAGIPEPRIERAIVARLLDEATGEA